MICWSIQVSKDIPAGLRSVIATLVPAIAPPRYALAVLALTVAGFVVTSSVGVAPAWAALGGCLLLLVPRVRARDVRVGRLIGETSPGFCLFVLALAVVVDAVTRHGLGDALRHLVPGGTSWAELLVAALVAAACALALRAHRAHA